MAASIELDEPVGTIYERWTEFEKLPRFVVGAVEARIRWRAEILTFEPMGGGARVTLRIEYDPAGGGAGLSRHVQGALESFKAFVEERSAEPGPRRGSAPGGGLASDPSVHLS